MELLTLYSGLLLPWLGGTCWLIFADSLFNHQSSVNRLRQAGYGFFFGYAVLFVAIMLDHRFSSHVSWPHVMVFMLAFTACGGFAAWWNRSKTISPTATTKDPTSLAAKILAVILLVLMTLHLVFIMVEIFTQPVYPWDAWLAWVYRAKAWFLAGNMTEIVSAKNWVSASAANVYTIDAFGYPLFASVIPYWAALCLGSWSETLVNLPVLFAGLALGMAVYGQCREQGLGFFVSLVICYMLYSIPLLGVHLALGGYADVWMAGFTGLGFIALLRGTILLNDKGKAGSQLVLGLVMITFGIWVKNEGAVWFLAALAVLVLASCRPRVLILITITLIILSMLMSVLGHSYIDIPLMGKLGLVDGRLAIPSIGDFVLQKHDVTKVYWNNFVAMGSWNLLWIVLSASLLLGFKTAAMPGAPRARRTALSFILVFVATQVFIFGFTNQGSWADTYTAINRLPLHFVPALLFAAGLMVQASLTQGRSSLETRNG